MPTPTNLTIRQQSKVLEIAFDDGAAFSIPFELLPDTDLIEDVCDNEKDADRIKGIEKK